MKAWLGIDTGGTFTDFVWFFPNTGTVKLVKVPPTRLLQSGCAEKDWSALASNSPMPGASCTERRW